MIRVLDFLPQEGAEGQVIERVGDDALPHLQRPGVGTGLVRWVDICGQRPADLARLGEGFGFHPLALEDCLHFDQRPKVEEFSGPEPYLFVVIHNFRELTAAAFLARGDGDGTFLAPAAAEVGTEAGSMVIEPLEVHAFLGCGYLVTVHEQENEALEGVYRRVLREGALLGRGSDFIYYLVADALGDSNFPVIERVGDLLDEIEEAVLSQPEKRHLHRIYQLRKALVSMRRALSPQRDVLGLLARHGGSPVVQARTAPYFRDVYDHLVRITEAIDSGRDLLGNCVDAYLSAVGQRTNEVMKQLTILSAVMLPLTFLSGFFGMNFEMLPFKSVPVFTATLVVMLVVLPVGMISWFRYKNWF